MEDILASNKLHIHSEERKLTTFQSSIGASNIDLNIANNKMLAFFIGFSSRCFSCICLVQLVDWGTSCPGKSELCLFVCSNDACYMLGN